MKIPALGFIGPSGSGKTTLLEKVLPILKDRGLRVGVFKLAHPKFDIDQPGKDSHRLRQAGADQMLVVSNKRWALMVETDEEAEYTLEHVIGRFERKSLDLVLMEGARYMQVPNIEVCRMGLDHLHIAWACLAILRYFQRILCIDCMNSGSSRVQILQWRCRLIDCSRCLVCYVQIYCLVCLTI